MKVVIDAYIDEIKANRAGDRAEKVQVSASYEACNICSGITFDVPLSEAGNYHVGQKIRIVIEEG